MTKLEKPDIVMFMYTFRAYMFCIFLVCILFSSCTFNYGAGNEGSNLIPDMILNEVTVDRYENALLSITLKAQSLEMYDTDKIWAAEDVSFVQYASDDSGTIDSEGFASLMLVDDEAEIYSLGKHTEIRLIKDNFFLKAEDLKWYKKINRLSSSVNGEVELSKDDGSSIQGVGFFADTLDRSYELKQNVSGQLVTGEALVEDIVSPEAE